jgi:hypothetical protein
MLAEPEPSKPEGKQSEVTFHIAVNDVAEVWHKEKISLRRSYIWPSHMGRPAVTSAIALPGPGRMVRRARYVPAPRTARLSN